MDTASLLLIFQHCENDYLSANSARYIGKIFALRTHLSVLPQHTDLPFDEPVKRVDAVREGNMAAIRELLAQHIDRTRRAYTDATGFVSRSLA